MYGGAELEEIPGDAGAVATGVCHLDQVADMLLRLSATLNAIADEDVTVGESVDAIRDRTRGASSNMKAAKPRYAETAVALQEFAVALEDAQSRCTRAGSDIEAEVESIRFYQEEVWELERQSLFLAIPVPNPDQQAELAQRLRYLRTKLADHEQVQQAAQAERDAAIGFWYEAGDRATQRLRPVLGELDDTLLDHLGSFVEGIEDFLPAVVEWIAKILDSVITAVQLNRIVLR